MDIDLVEFHQSCCLGHMSLINTFLDYYSIDFRNMYCFPIKRKKLVLTNNKKKNIAKVTQNFLQKTHL